MCSRTLSVAAVAAALLVAAPCLSQTPPAQGVARPAVETTKVEGTDNVYIFRNGNHQAMFIATTAGVIATDPIAYGRPTGGQTYVDEIRKVTDKPIKYLIYSHHHYDHIAGGKAFKDAGARIIAHRRVKEHLAPLGDPNTVLPDESFDDKKTITLGGTTLELLYLGPNHSDSNIVMLLRKEKLLFVVDTIPVGAMPGLGMIDIYPLETETFIKKVMALPWERMIPGHPGLPGGRLGTKEDAANVLALMQEASSEIRRLAQEGKCWQPVEKEFRMPKYASWPNYESGLPYIARRYCLLWGRGT
jgi:glyoxylase-like metal-dependent hydrolase (beta-lactamase superfamily II)